MSATVPQIPDPGLGFTPSPGMSDLFNDDPLVLKLAKVAPEIDRVLSQIQLDAVAPENRDTVGPTILALGEIRKVFRGMISRGDAVNQVNQAQSTKSTKTTDAPGKGSRRTR